MEVGIGPDCNRVEVGYLADARRRWTFHEPDDRRCAGETAVLVGGVDDSQCFGARPGYGGSPRARPKRSCCRTGQGISRAHQAARGLGVVAEKRPDLRLRRLWKSLQHREPAVLVEIGDQVGGVIGFHRREQPARLLVGPGAQELELMLGIELLEDVSLELQVLADGVDDLLALLVPDAASTRSAI